MTETPTRVLWGGGLAAAITAAFLNDGLLGFLDALSRFRPIFPSILEMMVGVTSLSANALTFVSAIGMIASRVWPVRIIQPGALLGAIGGMLALMHFLAFGETALVDLCILAPFVPLCMRFALGSPKKLSRLQPAAPLPERKSRSQG